VLSKTDRMEVWKAGNMDLYYHIRELELFTENCKNMMEKVKNELKGVRINDDMKIIPEIRQRIMDNIQSLKSSMSETEEIIVSMN
jgi:hypothetical protein